MAYTQSMDISSGLLKGYGSLVGAVLPSSRPPGFVRRFYQPHASALEALRSDWAAVAKDFRTVAEREIQQAKDQGGCSNRPLEEVAAK